MSEIVACVELCLGTPKDPATTCLVPSGQSATATLALKQGPTREMPRAVSRLLDCVFGTFNRTCPTPAAPLTDPTQASPLPLSSSRCCMLRVTGSKRMPPDCIRYQWTLFSKTWPWLICLSEQPTEDHDQFNVGNAALQSTRRSQVL